MIQDFSNQLYLKTDWSAGGMGAMLPQKDIKHTIDKADK